jgi:hypothetical protein
MQIPRLDKVVLNMGVGEATGDSKKPSVAAEDLALIAGQKAVVTRARNSIAGFKVRENMPIGAKVTLRKERMYEFIDRLVNDRAAARARLPRPEPEELRRPWQLRHGHQGAHRVPGDQLRQGRSDLGHGHHRLHDCSRRTTRRGRCSRRFNFPFRQ